MATQPKVYTHEERNAILETYCDQNDSFLNFSKDDAPAKKIEKTSLKQLEGESLTNIGEDWDPSTYRETYFGRRLNAPSEQVATLYDKAYLLPQLEKRELRLAAEEKERIVTATMNANIGHRPVIDYHRLLEIPNYKHQKGVTWDMWRKNGALKLDEDSGISGNSICQF